MSTVHYHESTDRAYARKLREAELAETVYITAALRAGGGAAHGMMAMKLYENAA